jgi:hypothetical protein
LASDLFNRLLNASPQSVAGWVRRSLGFSSPEFSGASLPTWERITAGQHELSDGIRLLGPIPALPASEQRRRAGSVSDTSNSTQCVSARPQLRAIAPNPREHRADVIGRFLVEPAAAASL